MSQKHLEWLRVPALSRRARSSRNSSMPFVRYKMCIKNKTWVTRWNLVIKFMKSISFDQIAEWITIHDSWFGGIGSPLCTTAAQKAFLFGGSLNLENYTFRDRIETDRALPRGEEEATHLDLRLSSVSPKMESPDKMSTESRLLIGWAVTRVFTYRGGRWQSSWIESSWSC